MEKKYIILDEDKHPAHKFKDGVGAFSWDAVQDQDNVALIVPEPFVVLDFDTETDAEIMLKIVEGLDLHCKVMKTDRGIHCWFRIPQEECGVIKNYTKGRTAIGIYSDRKVCSRNAYVVVKRYGRLRRWLRDYPDEEVALLPKWLNPVMCGGDFKLIGLGDGDGRNQLLFNYVLVLQEFGFSRDEVIDCFQVINQFVFKTPLPKSELKTICRKDAFKTDEEIAERVASKVDKFKHEVFAVELMDKFKVISVNRNLYIYADGYYQPNQNDIEMAMILMYAGIKDSQRQEVIKYLKIIADKTKELEEYKPNPFIINVKNGRLNLLTGELTGHSPDFYDFARVPITYNPEASSKAVDGVLNTIFCGDKEVINLVEEMLGSCLVSALIWQVAFIFYGSGANGKSTFFYLLRQFLGEKNVSSISLDKLGDRFTTVELEHKLANVGDDLSYTFIKDNGTVKKLISGDAVQVERKNEQPYSFVSYASQVFACNELPRTNDLSDGMRRRLCFIPCLAKFGQGGIKKNPRIKFDITTEDALSHLLNRAIRGLKRLDVNGEFTSPKIVEQAKADYIVENSTFLQWIEQDFITLEYVTGYETTTIFDNYKTFCEASNEKPFGKIRFYRELTRHFGLEPKPVQKWLGDNVRGRFFVVKIEE